MSICYGEGRLGNSIFRAVIVSMIIKKSKGKVTYQYQDELELLGIQLYKGDIIYDKTLILTESNFWDFQDNNFKVNFNIEIPITEFFQTRRVALFICDYVRQYFPSIYEANPFKERYQNNNDVFIHIRLGGGDVTIKNKGINYYEKAINMIENYDNGYIATDSPDNVMVTYISNKYNFKVLNELDRVQCIQFGSLTKHIILSYGTFSAIIGYMAIDSNIYYPSGDSGFCHDEILDIPWWHCVL
jgi:hypothetical protein